MFDLLFKNVFDFVRLGLNFLESVIEKIDRLIN